MCMLSSARLYCFLVHVRLCALSVMYTCYTLHQFKLEYIACSTRTNAYHQISLSPLYACVCSEVMRKARSFCIVQLLS